ncbi:hypothetical protein [Lysobacter gummosus]|uniref:hypothetical protein n=1 Tax=Lysobacter gummosus TaxID=262324 RepID=UPI003644505A
MPPTKGSVRERSTRCSSTVPTRYGPVVGGNAKDFGGAADAMPANMADNSRHSAANPNRRALARTVAASGIALKSAQRRGNDLNPIMPTS